MRFDSAYELTTALSAIDLTIPEDDGFHVLDPYIVQAATQGIWYAFFRKDQERPPAMPIRIEAEREREAWMEVSTHLIEAGRNIQAYLETLDGEEGI